MKAMPLNLNPEKPVLKTHGKQHLHNRWTFFPSDGNRAHLAVDRWGGLFASTASVPSGLWLCGGRGPTTERPLGRSGDWLSYVNATSPTQLPGAWNMSVRNDMCCKCGKLWISTTRYDKKEKNLIHNILYWFHDEIAFQIDWVKTHC